MTDRWCLVHASENEARLYLQETGIVDLRDAHIDAGDFERIVSLLPLDETGHRVAEVVLGSKLTLRGNLRVPNLRVTRYATFPHATFEKDLVLEGAKVQRSLQFVKCTFLGDLRLPHLKVGMDLSLAESRCKGKVALTNGAVGGDLLLVKASIEGGLDVRHTEVRGRISATRTKLSGLAQLQDVSAASVNLAAAEAKDKVSLIRVEIERGLVFDEAELEGGLSVTHTRVNEDISVEDAHIHCFAEFPRVVVGRHLRFRHTRFYGTASFYRAKVEGDIWFRKAHFGERAIFDFATVGRNSRFEDARFDSEVTFDGAQFLNGARFHGMRATTATFTGAQFKTNQSWGTLKVGDRLSLAYSQFDGALDVSLVAKSIDLTNLSLEAESSIEAIDADVVLNGATSRTPTVISGPQDDRGTKPHIVSTRYADLANFVLAGVDLTRCTFEGAHNLDKLVLERDVTLPQSPRGFRLPHGWPGLRRWTRRKTVLEEHLWRSTTRWSRGWTAPPPGKTSAPRSTPELTAETYRALRRGREDARDAPGAADFYYGEMEMRRHAARRLSAERLILTGYWALSGYGLRASRALIALAVTIALFTGLFHLYGFEDAEHPLGAPAGRSDQKAVSPAREAPTSLRELGEALGSVDAWAYTVSTASSITASQRAQLTQEGRVLHVLLRILGPILLALALLALRGRVKR